MPSNFVFTSDTYSLTDNGMSADPPSPSPSSASLEGLGDSFQGLCTASSPSSVDNMTPKVHDAPFPASCLNTGANPSASAPTATAAGSVPSDDVLFPSAHKLHTIMAALGPGPYDEDAQLIVHSVDNARHLMGLARRLVGDTETLFHANVAVNQSYELFSRSDYSAEQVGRKRRRQSESVIDDHAFYTGHPLHTPTGSEMHVDIESDFPSQTSDSGDTDDVLSSHFKIYLDHMDTTRAQDATQIAAWEKMNNAVLVRIYGAVPNAGDDTILACRTIEAAVRAALSLHCDEIVVSPPKRDVTVHNPSICPAYFLVVLGCPEDFWALKALPYINNQHASILILGHPPILPNSFIAMATGLTLSDSDKHVAILTRALTDALLFTPAATILCSHVTSNRNLFHARKGLEVGCLR